MQIRRASWADAVDLISWLINGREKNALDPSMLTWDARVLQVFVAELAGKKIAMVPAHTSVTLESVALNPDATPEEKLAGVVEAVKQIEVEARGNGVRQLNFISSDEKTDERAMKHLGFERCVCYVKKL